MKSVSIALLIFITCILVTTQGCGGNDAQTDVTLEAANLTITGPVNVNVSGSVNLTVSGPINIIISGANQTLPPLPYGTIYIASTDFGVEATDPTLFESAWSLAFCDSLITIDETGNYIGEVAESWALGEDGVTWTFNIRHGIKFHNGDPVTARDVLFTMERFTSENSSNVWSPGLRGAMASMRVVDDYTFEYVTITPEPSLVDVFCQVRIIPKDYFESVGEEQFNLHPVGSGPWKFVEYIPETSFTMEANTDYWGEVPAFQYVIDLQVPNEVTQVYLLMRGDIDIPLGLSMDTINQLEDDDWGTRIIGLPSPTIIAFTAPYYETAGPVYDIRIRKALSYAIDRKELCATFYQGTAVPGGRFVLAPGGYGVTDDLIAPDPYDPELAMSLLAEAGYPDAWEDPVIHCFTFEEVGLGRLYPGLLNTLRGSGLDFFKALQGYWNKVGLQVQIEVVEPNVWFSYIFIFGGLTGDEENVGWTWAWKGAVFNSTYYARNMYTSYGWHWVTNDPAVDALWDQYIVELDPVKAEELFIEFQRAAKELYTSFGIAYTFPKVIVSPNIGEFTSNTHLSIYDALEGIKHPE